MDWPTINLLVVVFLASFIRSGFGFGEGLVAVPLLSLSMPVKVAAPIVVLLSISIAAVVVVQDWREIHLSSATWLLCPTFLGVPLGVLLLAGPQQNIVKAILGAVISLFGAVSLSSKKLPKLAEDHRGALLACGFLAGVLGGAYGLNGPPLVLYGTMRRWSPQHFRATLQAYFLPASLVGLCGYVLAGLVTQEVLRLYLISLCAALPAIFLGRLLNRRLEGEAFLRIVYIVLTGLGLLLLSQSFR